MKAQYLPPSWYQAALKEIGVHELKGPDKNNARILEYFKSTALVASTDETPWCAAFVNWCLASAGIRGTHSARARSFLNWGVGLKAPCQGAIVVISRGINPSQGHVGIFDRVDPSDDAFYNLVGGNQKDSVSIAGFHKSRVLGIRWPKVSG